MRPVALLAMILTLFVIHPSASVHAEEDRVDVLALGIGNKLGPFYITEITVESGQVVLLYCGWQVGLVNNDKSWKAGGVEKVFPVLILVDNKPVGNLVGKLGPKTSLHSGHRRAVGFSGPATWIAKDPGDHQAVCVVNQPKQISDRDPNNNTTKPVTIRVTPKKMVALPLPSASPNKSCRPMLLADLGINKPKHFYDPNFGPAEVPKRELVLFLRHSEAAGNYVNCRYESKNKDVENYVVNVPCKGGVPVAGQQHMYSCKP